MTILNNHFEPHSQPVIDVDSGWLAAVEALLRLPVQEVEAIEPQRLIPAAESTGVIAQLRRVRELIGLEIVLPVSTCAPYCHHPSTGSLISDV